MSLKEYRRKRNFDETSEPADGGARGSRIFVVQLHHASRRHFDFRLELDGVLKSWAIPKGPSFDPKVKRLAVEVEDHPVSYAGFEGDIPKGNYGAGHVDVFDHGTWEPIGNAKRGLADGDLKFVLNGDILRGSWVLVRTRLQGSKQQWLLIKHQDEFAHARDADAFVDPKTDRPISLAQRRKTWGKTPRSSAAESSPAQTNASKRKPGLPPGAVAEIIANEAFAAQLCKSQESPPAGEEWLHEVKWDGYRILTTIVDGVVRLWSRNAIEWTRKLPELVKALSTLKIKHAQLDGEMIVLRDGQSDFNALQARLSAETSEPAVYMLFDMPHWNGYSFRDVALLERKQFLHKILTARAQPLLRFSEHQIGNGKAAFAQATAAGMEGIVSKRAASGYSGTRSGDWIKAKSRPSDEFVVVGFTEPKGSRSGIGALLLGKPRAGKMTYVGRVGTGLDDEQLRALRKRLRPTIVKNPSADFELMERKDRELAIWVKPKLIVEVFYQGIGGQGLLRQPAFKAMRDDKTLADLADTSGRKKLAQKTPRVSKAAKIAKVKPTQTVDVVITHPDREVFPALGVTKNDVANYYREVAPWLLAELANRPLSVVRCPDGAAKACFFQKHAGVGWGKHVHGVAITEKSGRRKYLCIADVAGLLELVQMNVLELHAWGAKSTDVEHADRIVFDLDPHASVPWSRVIAAARDVRTQLKSIGLESFLRTSGGKGLHVVVPLKPAAAWDVAKQFAQGIAQAMAALRPEEYVSVAGESKRKGKIFVDWLRNGRGATSIASYSLRARDKAGVSMPLGWDELGRLKAGDAFTIENALKRIRSRKIDPWAEISKIRQSLPKFQK